MSNMSYCRFENTDRDLGDCETALEELASGEHGKLSRSELVAAKSLVNSCVNILTLIADQAGKTIEDLDENDIDKALNTMNAAAEGEGE